MVRPIDPIRITLEDLINCCNGDTVVSILIDLNGFWTYENREVLVTDNAEEHSEIWIQFNTNLPLKSKYNAFANLNVKAVSMLYVEPIFTNLGKFI